MKYRIVTICLALILLLAPAVVETGPRGAHAQQANRVGLVVEHGDGSVTTRCIEFSEQEISGYDVLTRSGLNVVAAFESGMGAAVCAVGGEGCPAESCLTCDVPNYWAYWHLDGGAWVYSPIGVSSYTVHDGDVEGWRWGGGDPPDVIQFDQICAPPPHRYTSPPLRYTAPPHRHTRAPDRHFNSGGGDRHSAPTDSRGLVPPGRKPHRRRRLYDGALGHDQRPRGLPGWRKCGVERQPRGLPLGSAGIPLARRERSGGANSHTSAGSDRRIAVAIVNAAACFSACGRPLLVGLSHPWPHGNSVVAPLSLSYPAIRGGRLSTFYSSAGNVPVFTYSHSTRHTAVAHTHRLGRCSFGDRRAASRAQR